MQETNILSFLNKYFDATTALGQWWESSLSSGVTEASLRDYILNTYLSQIYPNNPEVVENIRNEWAIFSNPSTTEPIVETPAETIKEEIPQVENNQNVSNEFTEQDYANTDLSGFIYTFFGETGRSLIEWIAPQQHTGGAKSCMDYIFNTYLPSAGWNDIQINRMKEALVETIMETKKALESKADLKIELKETLVHPQVEAGETFEVHKPTISTGDVVLDETDNQTKVCTGLDESNNPILVNASQDILGGLQPSNQTESLMVQGEYQGDAIDNLKNIRSLEEDISTKLNQVMLLKEPYLIDGNYVNNSYNFCPSFKNLIEPIQMAIIKKREAKAKEKWFEKYRPELVEEILFPNNTIKETITEYVMKGRIAGNCMFYGEGGVGKTTTNQVLMNAVLKNAADRFFLDRKIESVDNLKGWLNKKPLGEQKIVIAEEFDRLSDAAMTELKNGLMEKYEYVVFLASTNKIHKIDEALLTRFTLISKFDTAQVQDLVSKCRYVLTNERIQFTEEDLAYFIEANKLKGIRTILNNLQLSCYMGVFEPKRTAFFVGDSGTEYDMVNWVKWYIQYLVQSPKELLYALSFNLESDQNISKARKTMLEILMSNYSLNFDYIFMELLKDNIFLPIKNCINEYYQDIDVKRIKSMHFEAMLNEFITILFTAKDVYR